MDFERLSKDIFAFLEGNLDQKIVYHTIDHTREIIENTIKLAHAENITGKDFSLLKTAALMHDLGYTQTHIEHEEISCQLSKKWLPKYGYSNEDIDIINSMIMSTRIPQTPGNLLGEVLCDADLYYLGGEDYFEKAELLYSEMKQLKTLENESQWLQLQIDFLTSHSFFTKTGKKTREPGKRKNLKSLFAKQNSIQNEQTL